MLTNMLSEIGIDEEIFAEACIKATTNPTHKMLLSEIMAVDNFLAFKKLMVKRNKELSEEALQLMNAKEAGIDPNLIYQQQNYGGASEDDEIAKAIQASLELEEAKKSGHTPPAPVDDEEEMMRQVMEQSKQEYELMQAIKKSEEAQKKQEEAKKEVKKEAPPKKEPKPAKKEEPPKKESPKVEKPAMKAPSKLAPIGGAKAAQQAADFDIQKHAEETAKLQKENEEKKQAAMAKKTMSKEEMKERMEKLKQQRNLLLQKKQQQLQKEWENYDDSDNKPESKKDRIGKGLEALGIKEGSVAYKTEEQKQKELERQEAAKKQKEEAKSS